MDTFLPTDADQAALFVWISSLVLGLVVSLVVALLLWLDIVLQGTTRSNDI